MRSSDNLLLFALARNRIQILRRTLEFLQHRLMKTLMGKNNSPVLKLTFKNDLREKMTRFIYENFSLLAMSYCQVRCGYFYLPVFPVVITVTTTTTSEIAKRLSDWRHHKKWLLIVEQVCAFAPVCACVHTHPILLGKGEEPAPGF